MSNEITPTTPTPNEPPRTPTFQEEASILADELGAEAAPLFATRASKFGFAAAMAVIALISFFFLGDLFSSPEFHAGTIAALDDQRNTALVLAASAATVGGVADLATLDSVASTLLELSGTFGIAIGAIYLEKYLLTIAGLAAFRLLVPAACLAFGIRVFVRPESRMRKLLAQFGGKMALFGIALVLLVPVSVGISGLIQDTYDTTLTQTIEQASQTTENISSYVEENPVADNANNSDFLAGIAEGAGNLLNDVAEGIQDAGASILDQATSTLNNLIEALAVMIVTTCVIPLMVLAFFLWLIKMFLGLDIPMPRNPMKGRKFPKPSKKKA